MNRLQEFFATMAYVEQNPDSTYVLDDSNHILLSECNKFYKIRTITKTRLPQTYKTIEISVEHSKPETMVTGFLTAPLIFPRVISNNLFRKFSEKDDRIYFRGLLTLRRVIEISSVLMNKKDLYGLVFLAINLILGRRQFTVETKKVYFKFSQRGRQLEHKFLDEAYYEEMSHFKYVFCPQGDFIWTYRFFEAIQVGSMPCLTKTCSLYKDFTYINVKSELEKTKDYQSKIPVNLNLIKNKFSLIKTKV